MRRYQCMAGGNVLAAMTVAMPMPMPSMWPAAETIIGRVAISCGAAVWGVLRRRLRAAIASWHKTHRYGANGRGPHHGQDDSARALHGVAPAAFQWMFDSGSFAANQASKSFARSVP